MIFSSPTYNGITFQRFVRGSGIMATAVPVDRIQIRTTKDPIPGQNGIQRYIDYYGARMVQVAGFVKGTSESDLYTNLLALQNAFDIKLLESSFPNTYGFSQFKWTDPGQGESYYLMKPISNTLQISEERKGLARSFSVVLEAKDPTKYSSTVRTVTITVSATSPGSTSAFPFGFPVAFSAPAFYAEGTINNPSSLVAYPQTITLTSPTTNSWTGAKITNMTTGEYIQFDASVAIGTTDNVVINSIAGTAIKTDVNGIQTNLSPFITTGSTFFTLNPGNNTIRIEGVNIPTGSNAIMVLNTY